MNSPHCNHARNREDCSMKIGTKDAIAKPPDLTKADQEREQKIT
jgi:hypothetical protein